MDVLCGRAQSARTVVGLCALLVVLLTVRSAESGGAAAGYLTPGFRPPSVPLIVVDPYLSVWSNADHLYDDFPRHWSGSVVCLSGMIRIDGKLYRFMAKDTDLAANAMQQTNLTVYPTQTVYVFQQDGVQLQLTFSTPDYTFPTPVRPMTYITYEVSTIDGKSHSVQLYYDNTAEGAVANVNEKVTWNRVSVPDVIAMRIGTEDQDYLGQTGDRINWGYWYVAVPSDSSVSTTMASSTSVRTAFMAGTKLPPDDTDQPRPCSDNWPVLAVVWDLGMVQPSVSITKHLIVLYDQVYSIRYFGTAMAPFWKPLYNESVEVLIQVADESYADSIKNCDSVDQATIKALFKAGGSNYSTITSLAWRQAIGGTIAVWNNVTEEIWIFMKEISSGGYVSTVDVLFPSSPVFLWTDPDSLQYMLKPILEYSNNDTKKYGLYIPYNLSWAPHTLGKWPICDFPPSKPEQMPVEVSGDMISMIAGIVFWDPYNDVSWLKPYWPVLSTWANYTVDSLPDPGNQLCTDDFEGPSPHNVNLAAKGIVALGAFSYLLRMDGKKEVADYYDKLNEGFVEYWMKNASDGDHYRLQYNLPNTWSLKYNLLYQKVLQLKLFPDSVFDTEEKYYQTKMNKYGVPLDDRADFTKTDWLMWVAAMGNEEQFQTITDVVYMFANETPDRTPFTDWYETSTGQRRGFTARPVIGGLFARVLTHALYETQQHWT